MWICYPRVIKRLFFKDPEIKDRAEQCDERLRWKLLSYMWSFEQRVAERITYLKKTYPNVEFVEVRSDRDLARLEKHLF